MPHITPETEALLFDCDGTLADTMPLHFEAWEQTLAEYNVSCPRPFLEARNGIPTERIVQEINQSFGSHLIPEQFAETKETKFMQNISLIKPIVPIVQVLLDHVGRMKIAVVSGGRRENVEATLKKIGVYELVEEIITADDPIAPKPSPEIFLEAARRFGILPERCHVFEDADPGIEAAKAAGMNWTDVRRLF